jgi:hypothetical protein
MSYKIIVYISGIFFFVIIIKAMKDEPYFYLIIKQTRIIRGILNADNTDLTDKHG